MKIQIKHINTLSNYISFLRILLAIPIYYFVSNIDSIPNSRIILIALFIFAYITDLLDGYFARKNNEITELGKIIDPLADKILVIMIAAYYYYFKMIPEYYFWIIILRDLIIFIGGIFVSNKIGKVLPSNYLGKGTVFSIGLFIIAVTLGLDNNNLVYQVLLYLSIILSFSSVFSYGYRAFNEIKRN